MVQIRKLDVPGYEKVIEGKDEESGLLCYIAIHNTKLGPSLGGTRVYPYETSEEALNDVLRLSEGMTYKSALAQVGFGGGKAVIVADPYKQKTKQLLLAYAEVVNSLNGDYISAEDVGTTTDDIEIMLQKTPHLVGLPLHHGRGSGDPSPFTAWGVFRGIQAVCETLFGSPSLQGKTVAIQGLGKVGTALADYLFWHGARLIISDVKKTRVEEMQKLYGATVVEPNEIHKVTCDIFCPSALGGIINEETVPLLRCKAVAGPANNQLATLKDAQRLADRNILYAPDFIINAGGLMNVSCELSPDGYHAEIVRDQVDNIYKVLVELFERASNEGKSTVEIAMDLAKYNIDNGVGKRKNPVVYSQS